MADEKTFDYGTDAQLGAGDNILAQIDHIAQMQLDAETEVEQAQENLKAAQAKLRDIAERQLPELMDTARQKSLTTSSDLKVEVKDKVRASLPEVRREAGLQWLRDRNHASVIKTQLVIPFEAGRDPAAVALRALLILFSKRQDLLDLVRTFVRDHCPIEEVIIAPVFSFLWAIGNDAEARIQLDAAVHAQTLAALVRLRLIEGKITQADMELLGAHAWKETKVTRK